jgi:hypothetical protein
VKRCKNYLCHDKAISRIKRKKEKQKQFDDAVDGIKRETKRDEIVKLPANNSHQSQ